MFTLFEARTRQRIDFLAPMPRELAVIHICTAKDADQGDFNTLAASPNTIACQASFRDAHHILRRATPSTVLETKKNWRSNRACHAYKLARIRSRSTRSARNRYRDCRVARLEHDLKARASARALHRCALFHQQVHSVAIIGPLCAVRVLRAHPQRVCFAPMSRH
jgi:hypothetical protein